MDAKPFLEFNMFNFDEGLAEELKKFSKSSFELSEILATASELKYTKEIKRILAEQFSDPSEEFLSFLLRRCIRAKVSGSNAAIYPADENCSMLSVTNSACRRACASARRPALNKSSQTKSQIAGRLLPRDELQLLRHESHSPRGG